MRTPLPTFVTLTVISVCGMVGVTAQPAYAACDKPEQGQQISDTPWQLKELWDLSKLPPDATGRDIRVAVLDSGVDEGHPQLKGKVISTDPLKSQPGSQDLCGHGTAVAGVIAGRKLPNVGFQGIAPDAVILSARVSEKVAGNDDAQPVSPQMMGDTVRWAVANGAKVINISFAYTSPTSLEPFKQAIDDAIAQGVVVIAAAGNNNTKEKGNPTPYPAAWPGVVAVAAIGRDGARLPQSGAGDYVDITAPGVDVLAPRPGSGYSHDNTGTSFAAPMVAATAALIFDRFPGITGKEVVQRLLATADPSPGGQRSHGYGVGVVNPVRAVTEVVDNALPAQARALPAPSMDPVASGAAARAERLRQQALWLGAFGMVAALVAVALMLALPAGTRRRWRPAGR